MFVCQFEVWFTLQIFPSGFLTDTPFYKVRYSCSGLDLDWAAYCAGVFYHQRGWCLPQFPDQCICEKPACVISAFLLFSKWGGKSMGKPRKPIGKSPTEALSQEGCVPANTDKVQKNVSMSAFSFYIDVYYFILGIRTLRKILGRFQVAYETSSSWFLHGSLPCRVNGLEVLRLLDIHSSQSFKIRVVVRGAQQITPLFIVWVTDKEDKE